MQTNQSHEHRPPPLRTDGSNDFAYHSMAVRVPSIIDETAERNPDYSPEIANGLRRLSDEIRGNAPLRLFELPAPDHDLWRSRFAAHAGESWLDTGWFFAEMLSYRLVMEACRYLSTLRDPFAPFKREELGSEALWDLLDEALDDRGALDERIVAALKLTLWGNRIDLSLASVAEKGTGASDEHLLADGSAEAVRRLLDAERGNVHIIMDNAGTEEAMDLVLADLLLSSDVAFRVVLHVKLLPVLVSDVITADVLQMLGAMKERGGPPAALAARLEGFIGRGRLRIVPDAFWNTDGRLWELPLRLGRSFGSAPLVLAKGDVNYRRSTNDAVWPLETPLEQAVEDFPAPLLLLRTLKSDTLVGVAPQRGDALDEEEPGWRTNGTYGVIQYAFGTNPRNAASPRPQDRRGGGVER